MPELDFNRFSDVVAFMFSFMPGTTNPNYFFDASGGQITYTRDLHIDANVSVSGSSLSVNGDGLLSGTINTMEFSYGTDDAFATLTGLSLSGLEFTNILIDRLNGDFSAQGRFEAFIGEGLGTVNLNDTDDEVSMTGFVEYLDLVDLGRGDDLFRAGVVERSGLTIDGGLGHDTLEIVFFSTVDTLVVDLSTGTIHADEQTFSFTGFEEIIGHFNVQQYILSEGDDIVYASVPDDVLNGAGGNDLLSGAFGNDVLNGGAGDDILLGGLGDDTIITGSGSNVVTAGDGFDVIIATGSGTHDVGMFAVNVTSVTETFVDRFETQIGTQARISLEGMTRYQDVIDGGHRASLELSDQDDAFFLHDAYSDFHSSLSLNEDFSGQDSTARVSDVAAIYGMGGNDIIDFTSPDYSMRFANMTIDGGQGDDVIWGSDANERIFGGDGDDTLFGGIGRDWLTGGTGADVFEFTRTSTLTFVRDFDAAEGDVLRFYNAGGAQFDASSLALTAAGITIAYTDTESGTQHTLSLNLAERIADFTSTYEDVMNALEVISFELI